MYLSYNLFLKNLSNGIRAIVMGPKVATAMEEFEATNPSLGLETRITSLQKQADERRKFIQTFSERFDKLEALLTQLIKRKTEQGGVTLEIPSVLGSKLAVADLKRSSDERLQAFQKMKRFDRNEMMKAQLTKEKPVEKRVKDPAKSIPIISPSPETHRGDEILPLSPTKSTNLHSASSSGLKCEDEILGLKCCHQKSMESKYARKVFDIMTDEIIRKKVHKNDTKFSSGEPGECEKTAEEGIGEDCLHGNMLTSWDPGDSIVITKSLSNMVSSRPQIEVNKLHVNIRTCESEEALAVIGAIAGNYASVNGILGSANSIFKKFRYQYRTNELFLDLKYCLDSFAAPLFEIILETSLLVDSAASSGGLPAILKPLFESQRLCCRIFFLLNIQDLPEFFEDHMNQWRGEFKKYLPSKYLFLESTADGLRLVEDLHPANCENINLYMGKSEKEFQEFLNDFASAVEDCVNEIDAQRVLGYALYKYGKHTKLSYPLAQFHSDFAGRSSHNGRFVQRMREKASSLPNVRMDQGTVTVLIEENGIIKGVQYKTKDGQEIKSFAPLTIVCDGCFSNLRRSLCTPKVEVPSNFVGLVLENCNLRFANHGHVVVMKSIKVGRGQFGNTCSANFKKEELKGKVDAAKIIPNSKMTTAIAIEDVRWEVKNLQVLSAHENLVPFYDAIEHNLNVYIAMKLCEGDELLDRILTRAVVDGNEFLDYGEFVAVVIHLQKIENDEPFKLAYDDLEPYEKIYAPTTLATAGDFWALRYSTTRFKCGVNYQPPTVVPGGDLTMVQRAVVDFSSLNIANKRYVGYLRSTIIGDTLARMLEYSKVKVLRRNNVGAWGTQFGVLIEYLFEKFLDTDNVTETAIKDLQAFYKESKSKFDLDLDFKEKAQQVVVRLQGGDHVYCKAWAKICEISRIEFAKIYQRLRVELEKGKRYPKTHLEDKVSSKGDGIDKTMVSSALVDNRRRSKRYGSTEKYIKETEEQRYKCRKREGTSYYSVALLLLSTMSFYI